MDDLINRESMAPWEPKGQVRPGELPDTAPEAYPPPWTVSDRGNGHIDLYDGNGKYLVHIYLWDRNDNRVLNAKLKAVNAACKREDNG